MKKRLKARLRKCRRKRIIEYLSYLFFFVIEKLFFLKENKSSVVPTSTLSSQKSVSSDRSINNFLKLLKGKRKGNRKKNV